MTQQPSVEPQLEEIRMKTDVLVFGGGATGANAALEIANRGYRVILAEKKARSAMDEPSDDAGQAQPLGDAVAANQAIEVMPETHLVGAAGVAGDFKVWLSGAEAIDERNVGAIVVTGELGRHSLEAHYNLALRDDIIPQSSLEKKLKASPRQFEGKSIAFLLGFGQQGNPLVLKRTLKSAAALCDLQGCTTYIYVNDLKVAHNGLERMYLECRDKGAICVKLQQTPSVKTKDNTLSIKYMDPVLRREMVLQPDTIVVEEQLTPDSVNEMIAELLKIDMGSAGFLQKDNIHRYPVDTNRTGIFVIGASRSVQMPQDALVDAKNVALQIHALLGTDTRQMPGDKAVLDTGKCTFCLTCFRCCPHSAIHWQNENKPVISKIACQACGICASECPMDAIQIGEFTDDCMAETIHAIIKREKQIPRIIAFCCQNSAHEAGLTAEAFKMDLPKGLKMVKVPCAGKIDMDYIMTAFAQGADGVLVMACHSGNCKSEQGNTFASWRVAEAQNKLETAGLEKARLRYVTLASNMSAEFSTAARVMEETINEIGLNPLGV